MDNIKIINDLISISKRIEKKSRTISIILKEKSEYHPFISDGLRLIENSLENDVIESIMVLDLEQKNAKLIHHLDILKILAKYPPVFGMIGTVTGLIALLSNMTKDSNTIIGPAIVIALITTLYGLLLANYFFIPMSDNLLQRLNNDQTHMRTIIHGITLLGEKTKPLILREQLAVQVHKDKRNLIESVDIPERA